MKESCERCPFLGKCQSHELDLKSSVRKHHGYAYLSCTHLNLPLGRNYSVHVGKQTKCRESSCPHDGRGSGCKGWILIPMCQQKRVLLGEKYSTR